MSIDVTRSTPTRDLDSESQVAEMVRRFYADVAQDDLLGPMFNDVAQVDWAEHLPKLTAFWCRALFGLEGYSGNPFRAHQLIHAQRSFTIDHFLRWLELFGETVDLGWIGPNAEKVKAIAHNVARVHSHQLLDGSGLAVSQPGAEPASVCPGDIGKLDVLAGVGEYPMRVKCATLAWHTLREALGADAQATAATAPEEGS